MTISFSISVVKRSQTTVGATHVKVEDHAGEGGGDDLADGQHPQPGVEAELLDLARKKSCFTFSSFKRTVEADLGR